MTMPDIPIVNAGNLYIDRLLLLYDAANIVQISRGQCRDISNVTDIVLPATINVATNVNGVNGLDQGTIAPSTFYSVYVIADSTGKNATAGILSLSVIQPVLPRGYDAYRRIGSIGTDGGSNILPFDQSGRDKSRVIWYSTPIQVLNGGNSAAYANVSLATAIPATAELAYFEAQITPTGAGNEGFVAETSNTAGNGNARVSGSVAAVPQDAEIIVPIAFDQNVEYKVTGTLSLWVKGYQDVIV